MLRLLPERLYAGLFGSQAWLAQGNGREPLSGPASLPANASPAELLDALLLMAPKRRRAGKLSVMLPSQSARCVGLPWSPHLRGDDEKQAYALAHFEQAGLSVGVGDAVHAEFRHYGAQGFAYAVPQQLLVDLHAVAARHSLNLTTVLPIGGVAQLAARPARGAGFDLALVVEEASISAQVMDRTGLQRYDAEPAVGGQRAALRRLLTRLTSNASEITGITLCADRDDGELAELAGAFAAQASVHRVKSSQWRRFL